LKRRFFGKVKAGELKYGRLARRGAQQQMNVAFLRELNAIQVPIHFAYVHKPFALMCKAVDWLVTPVLAREGIDFNEQGSNLAFANVLYYASGDFGGPECRSGYLRQ
jgi:hypothetical protein